MKNKPKITEVLVANDKSDYFGIQMFDDISYIVIKGHNDVFQEAYEYVGDLIDAKKSGANLAILKAEIEEEWAGRKIGNS